MKVITLFLTMLLSFFLTVSGNTAQLVTNGDFQTGDFTGWNVDQTYIPNSCLVVVDIYGGDDLTATWSGWGVNGRDGIYDSISQRLATAQGHNYVLKFDLTHIVDPGNFRVTWEGNEILSLINPPAFDQNYTFHLDANSPSGSLLTFSGFETEGLWLLDCVSVNGKEGPPVAPIPGSLLLLGSGLIAVVGFRKRS
jgi:hypothetical protein